MSSSCKMEKKGKIRLLNNLFCRSCNSMLWYRWLKGLMVKVGLIFVIQRCCSSYNRDRHRCNQGPTWQRLSTLRWRCIRCWTGACKGPRMAQEMLQVSRLQQNSRLYHRLRRARQRRLLQDLLRKEMGTARIRIRMWIGILTNRWPNVSNSLL